MSRNEVQLSFDSLVELDNGIIDHTLKRHLSAIATDCINRPLDDANRKVTLEFTVKPVLNHETRECDSCKVEIECKSKVPVHRSQTYQMRVTRSGLLFNQDFPDSLRQEALPLGDEEE